MDSWKLLKDSRVQVALVLTAVWLLVLGFAQDKLLAFLYPVLAIITVITIDLLITYFRSRKLYFPAASLVTGFLIGLIIAPTEPVWVILIAALLASFSKQFIGAGIRRHIFNPAAFGIMAVSLIFGTAVSWWGVAWSRWPLLILIPGMIWILWRLKRLWLPITFLVVYYLSLITLISPTDAFKTLFDGSVMLFALVMLTEPITSPAWGYFKYLFGALVAVLAIGIAGFVPADNFLAALLAGNLIACLALKLPKNIISKLKSTP